MPQSIKSKRERLTKKVSKLEDALKKQGKTAIVYVDCKGLKALLFEILGVDLAPLSEF